MGKTCHSASQPEQPKQRATLERKQKRFAIENEDLTLTKVTDAALNKDSDHINAPEAKEIHELKEELHCSQTVYQKLDLYIKYEEKHKQYHAITFEYKELKKVFEDSK